MGLKPLIGDRRERGRRLPLLPGARDRRRKMRGVDEAKIAEIWDFERSTALRRGRAGGAAVRARRSARPERGHARAFEELRRHWDDGQIVEILAVIGLFGFLNRWNDTMATDLEEIPLAFADDRYGEHWEPGKHRTGGEPRPASP